MDHSLTINIEIADVMLHVKQNEIINDDDDNKKNSEVVVLRA